MPTRLTPLVVAVPFASVVAVPTSLPLRVKWMPARDRGPAGGQRRREVSGAAEGAARRCDGEGRRPGSTKRR